MPQISEIAEAMEVQLDESATSTSLMVSSSTPEQVPTASRALRVRKSNTKSTPSRSSSSSSGRPPLPDSGDLSHRGPGSIVAAGSQAVTPVGSHPATPRRPSGVSDDGQASVFQDQRSLNQHNATQNVMYDQRSVHQQVNVGVHPNVAASAIAHAQVVESQATQMLSQAQHRVQSIEQEAMQHVRGVESQAQQAVAKASHHALEAESRANEIVAQMQSHHQRELNEVQAVANQANQAYQEVRN